MFSAHLAEPHYVPVILAHCMSQLFKFPSWPQKSHIPCSNRDVLPTSNILDLWYTSGIHVTYARCLTVGAVIVIPGCDRSGIKGVIGVYHHSVSRAEFSLTEPIPLRAVYTDHSRNPRFCMARLGHEHMVVDLKSSSALGVNFFHEDFRPVVLCYHHP